MNKVESSNSDNNSSNIQQSNRSVQFSPKNIAIASGKGGVGKSTVTVNLASALTLQGFKVGILDADIYGPSIGHMMGANKNTQVSIIKKEDHNYYQPLNLHGIKVMSIAFLTEDKTPVIWRGPMASRALQQMLVNTWWGDLDFLIIDLPPGTGDIQITLSQKISLAGSVIVTTPQDLALLDVKRAIEMFKKVEVPVLGVVENMSSYVCSCCGHTDAIFGQLGAQSLSNEYNVETLASLPLNKHIREHSDQGLPITLSKDDQISILFQKATKALLQSMDKEQFKIELPNIDVS